MNIETREDFPPQMAKIIASALSDRIPGLEGIRIGRTYTVLFTDGKALRYRTPPAIRDQIEPFIKTGEFKVGDYTLEPVGGAFDD